MGEDLKSKTKLPYEPPRIFDLFASPAYAQDPWAPDAGAKQCRAGGGISSFCTVGGSPAQECKLGGAATGGKCQSGSTAALV